MFGKSKKVLKQEIKELTEKLEVLNVDNKVLHDLFDKMELPKSQVISVRLAYLDKRLAEALWELSDKENRYGNYQKVQDKFELFKFTLNTVKKFFEHGYITTLSFATHATWPKEMESNTSYVKSAKKIRKFLLPELENALSSRNVLFKIEYGDTEVKEITLQDYKIMPTKNIVQELLNYSKNIADTVLPLDIKDANEVD